jgi:hypothetical protein
MNGWIGFGCAAVLLTVGAGGQGADEVNALVVQPTPFVVTTHLAKTVDMPKSGTVMLPVTLTISAQYRRPIRVVDPHGCSLRLWGVLRKSQAIISRRTTLPGGDTEVSLENAVEQHTRCAAEAPDAIFALAGRETRQIELSFPLDAALYRDGETYRLWLDAYESGGGGDFVVHKTP